MRLQMIGGTNAREHQNLRRTKGATREDHRTAGADGAGRPSLPDADADRTAIFDQNLFDIGSGFNMQTSGCLLRHHIGPRCRPAFTGPLRDLIQPHAFQLLAIEIGIAGHL